MGRIIEFSLMNYYTGEYGEDEYPDGYKFIGIADASSKPGIFSAEEQIGANNEWNDYGSYCIKKVSRP